MPQVAAIDDPSVEPEIVPPVDEGLYVEVLKWVSERLQPAGLPKPLCKRVAIVVCGLVASQKATLGQLALVIAGLAVTKASGESVGRRLQRTLDDGRLDPSLLPVIFRPVLSWVLRSQLLAHAANVNTPAAHHERFKGVIIVFDESSQADHVHLAVAGVPIGGLVLPLALRTWKQNEPMPEGEYWVQVSGLLQEIQEMLPPELRDHVLLTGDRLYGVPGMVDRLIALGWNWLLRVQGQTQVLMSDGTCHAIRTLVPRPGTRWTSGFSGFTAESASDSAASAAESKPVGVFKSAGWRRSQVVAIWAEGQADPWLLVTSLTATLARVAEYAERWAIERLFLCWKSHGWDIETSGVHQPQRLGRLLTAMAIATLWRLAMALPTALQHLANLARRVSGQPRQLRLPGFTRPPRPWASKFSLFTWGWDTARNASLKTSVPALCWTFPSWEGRTWSEVCRDTCLAARGQFSVSP